jgi:hypothetical protein
LISVSDMVTCVEHPDGPAKMDEVVDQVRHCTPVYSLALEGKLKSISVISAML